MTTPDQQPPITATSSERTSGWGAAVLAVVLAVLILLTGFTLYRASGHGTVRTVVSRAAEIRALVRG